MGNRPAVELQIVATILLVGLCPMGTVAAEPVAAASQPSAASQPAAASQPLPGSAAQASMTPPTANPSRDDPYAGLDHTGTPPLPSRENRLPAQIDKPTHRRGRTFYEGRPAEGLSAGELLIWIPRTIFLPVHLTLEYLVRRPLVFLVTGMEKHHVLEKVQDFFSFSDRRGGSGAIYPTFFWDFGTQVTVGVLASYREILGSDHNLSLSATFWPGSTGTANVGDTFKVFSDESGVVTIRGSYVDRRDFRFFGLGPNSSQADETFFRQRQFQGELSLRTALAGLNRVGFGAFYRTAEPQPTTANPSLETAFDTSDTAVVPGWNEAYHLLEFQTRLELDSRSPERVFTPGSGVRFEAFGSFAVAPHRPALNFIKWGAEAAGFWDFSGNNNVLALRVYAAALEATGGDPVPFSELIQLGGFEHLRGYSIGRFHGESALVATASYRYPIWLFLDADIFVGVGNVFDGRWEQLHVKRMVMNWGLALRTSMSRVTSFDLLLAFGTNRFQQWDDGFALDNVRFTVAVNQGF